MKTLVTQLGLLVCLGACLHAFAGEEVAVEPVERLIARLNAPDYNEREEATTQLMVRDDVDEAVLRSAFASDLTPEQRQRLTRVALHKYFAGKEVEPTVRPRVITGGAGLGITTDGGINRFILPNVYDTLGRPAFMVTATIPGFPAYAWLRPGDMITALGDQPITEGNNFSELLKGYVPGDEITLSIVRDGAAKSITLRLGSLDRLSAVYGKITHGESWAVSTPGFRAYLDAIRPRESTTERVEVHAPIPPGAEQTGSENEKPVDAL